MLSYFCTNDTSRFYYKYNKCVIIWTRPFENDTQMITYEKMRTIYATIMSSIIYSLSIQFIFLFLFLFVIRVEQYHVYLWMNFKQSPKYWLNTMILKGMIRIKLVIISINFKSCFVFIRLRNYIHYLLYFLNWCLKFVALLTNNKFQIPHLKCK